MLVRLEDYRRAAAVATDLVNTAPEVRASSGDAIADPIALGQFLVEHRVLHRTPTAADLAAVHRLRRSLRHLIEVPDEHDAVATAGALAARAGTGPVLERDAGGHWQWHAASRPGAGLADELTLLTATGLLAVIRVLGHDRFRRCALPSCAGVFVDTSRAGRRRYCEPEVCGSRANAASYRARRRAIDAGGLAGRPRSG
jgi:predicted RNA-binding Zn ribbon-like protein